jgi:hypothetical protein
MRFKLVKYYLKTILSRGLPLLFFTGTVWAQPEIKLPAYINLVINESEFSLSTGWIDSLVDDALSGKIHYKIIGAKRSERYILTNVQIPQILTLREVLRQIVIYYSLIPDEKAREKEILKIYPYFNPPEGKSALVVKYITAGKFNIELNRWETIPLPEPPIPEDKDIFNQILQEAFDGPQSIGDVKDVVLEKVAARNNRTIGQVRSIYQNIVLWQIGSQIRFQKE